MTYDSSSLMEFPSTVQLATLVFSLFVAYIGYHSARKMNNGSKSVLQMVLAAVVLIGLGSALELMQRMQGIVDGEWLKLLDFVTVVALFVAVTYLKGKK